MGQAAGLKSLASLRSHLDPGGILYLSTPNTTDSKPQYRVHVHEWDDTSLSSALQSAGFSIERRYGLLPTSPGATSQALAEAFGPGASNWFRTLRDIAPAEFLEPLCALTVPEAAKEIFYVCRAT
jgi:hypothetical protein